MTTTTSLYETCQNLFEQYPLAINGNGAMTLMLGADRDPEFFILIHWDKDGTDDACFDLIRWRNADAVGRIEAHTGTEDLPDAARILAAAVPLPRDGAFLAWQSGGIVTAVMNLIGDENPVPTWTSRIPEGLPLSSWPSFVTRGTLGSWFWDYYRSGDIVDLAPLTAATPGAIFWAQPASLTWPCCAVARDITSPDGWTLPQGAYVYFESLQNGETAGSLDELLAGHLTDLSPRFRTEA